MDLNQALKEIKSLEKELDYLESDIHDAERNKEYGLLTLQSQMWEKKFKYLFIDVPESIEGLQFQPHQIKFFAKMIEIKDALKSLGIPPYYLICLYSSMVEQLFCKQ